MKNIHLLLSIGILFSCSTSEYQDTESGISYKFIVQSETDTPNDGDVMELHLIYSDSQGKELLNTTLNSNGPVPVLYQAEKFTANGSIEEIFGMLTDGDSIEAMIPAGKVFESFGQPLPDSIAADSNLTFLIGVAGVTSRREYTKRIANNYMTEAKQQLALSASQVQIDSEIIDQYLSENNLEANTTDSGIRYIITEPGEGENAKPGDQVSVNYTGRVLDGQIFDTSLQEVAQENNTYNPMRPYQPYSFTLGMGEVIYGWDEGIGLLNKGAKATLFIPSSMGYGAQKVDEILVENSILVFEVELVGLQQL